MIDELAGYAGRIAKVEGPTRSGKTEVLVRRCARLLEQGVKPSSILVVVSSGFARECFLRRLRCAVAPGLEERAERVAVRRAIEVCASVLDEPPAREATGRRPRILVDGEYQFFLEDMKTLGQKNRRLSGMLSFFFAQWSAFEDEEAWLRGEERAVLKHARTVLRQYGAMLRHEAPYLCGKLLSSKAGRPLAQRYDYVLCDDFQNLSRAEQVCLCLCARTQVVVCGNADQATHVNTDYPCPEGFEKFDRVRRGVDVFSLDGAFGIAQAVAFGEALRMAKRLAQEAKGASGAERARDAEGAQGEKAAGGAQDAGQCVAGRASQQVDPRLSGKALFLEWQTPEDELAGLSTIVEAFCAGDASARPGDVVVAVPTRTWGRFAQKALEQAGVRASVAGLGPRLGGDPRREGHHGALTAYVKLCLAAAPDDALAWRAWTGFDNALTNSEVWGILHKRAADEGRSLCSVLEAAVGGEPVLSEAPLKEEALRKAWKAGWEVVERCRELRGEALARAVGMTDEPAFAELLSFAVGNEDAAALRDLVRAYLAAPRFSDDPDVVRIALYENLCGVGCRCLVAPGMVDGLVPCRDAFDDVKSEAERCRALDGDRRRVCSFVAKGARFLVASSFAQADIETAERSGMRVLRIMSAGRGRMALLSRSSFFEEAGDACPVFESGSTEAVEHFFQRG